MKFFLIRVLNALGAVEAMEWLTIALVVFAGVQIYVMNRTERREAQESADDDEREQDVAFHVLTAETFRLESVVRQIEQMDLVQAAIDEVLPEGEIRITDPSMLSQAYGRLGYIPARMGAAGLARFAEMGREFFLFRKAVNKYGQSSAQTDPQLRAKELELKVLFREAVNCMDDALRQSRRHHVPRRIEWLCEPTSGFGRDFKALTEGQAGIIQSGKQLDRTD
jgi:hypothetical protein